MWPLNSDDSQHLAWTLGLWNIAHQQDEPKRTPPTAVNGRLFLKKKPTKKSGGIKRICNCNVNYQLNDMMCKWMVTGHFRDYSDGWKGCDSTPNQVGTWARQSIHFWPFHSSNAKIVEIWWEEEEQIWWKVRGPPAVIVSCCVMTRRARTPVGSCCYILDQEEGLSSVTKNTKDHFSSLQVCAITLGFISFYHLISIIQLWNLTWQI